MKNILLKFWYIIIINIFFVSAFALSYFEKMLIY